MEDSAYLASQLITCIGNKRALLPFLDDVFARVRRSLGDRPLNILDAFAGSGVVSRYFKQHARRLISNDLETYAAVIGRCYLANRTDIDLDALAARHAALVRRAEAEPKNDGLIRRLYAPRDDRAIRSGERAFYTVENARRLDTLRQLIESEPEPLRPYFLGPLLSAASVHANTSGVFKGFYKDRATGIGRFGGAGEDALKRILGRIELALPVLSRFTCEWEMHCRDAGELIRQIEPVDVAYFDPPYNQHPYGSNYFMLNLLCEYREPREISPVSGIPADWKRSAYNRRAAARDAFADLVRQTRAAVILVSYNNEGFLGRDTILDILKERGRTRVFERPYHTFRGSRNLNGRDLHVKELLFVTYCRD